MQKGRKKVGVTVKPDELVGAIDREFTEYVDMATKDVKKIVKKVADNTKNEISRNAPVKTGRYKKSWTVTKTKDTSLTTLMTVHSKTRYRLTHLLENGHAKRGGGRTRAFLHIAPAEVKAEKELMESVERSLK